MERARVLAEQKTDKRARYVFNGTVTAASTPVACGRTLAVEQASGVLMKLDIATRQWHADVDAPWLHLLQPTVSRADYLTQLVRTYGFVAPFESACKYTPHLERSLMYHRFSRAGLIAQDLLTLGLSPGQIATVPQCLSITTFKDVAEAMGWLYVVERATLLHAGIRRHLVARLPELENACAYLAVDAGRGGEHWAAFGRAIDRIGAKPAVADEIAAAAHEAFACVRHWFRTASEPRRPVVRERVDIADAESEARRE